MDNLQWNRRSKVATDMEVELSRGVWGGRGRAGLGRKESVSFQTSSCRTTGNSMDPGNEKQPPADGNIIIKRFMGSLASTTPLNSIRENSINLPHKFINTPVPACIFSSLNSSLNGFAFRETRLLELYPPLL